MMSTIAAVSAQWRAEPNANMTKITDRMLDLQSQSRFDLAALRRATEERFHQMEQMNLNGSQCYRGLLQGSDQAVTQMNHNIQILIREHDIMKDKIDFLIHYIKGAYEEEERPRHEDISGGNTDRDSTPRVRHPRGGPALRLYQDRSPDLQLPDFERSLQALDDRIEGHIANSARDT